MARCPACGTIVQPVADSCQYCGARFQAPAPDEPISAPPAVVDIPFTTLHCKLAGWLGAVVALSVLGALAWWLATGMLGPDTTDDQWVGVALYLSLPLNAVRAFLRIRTGKPASFGPQLTFHTQFPRGQRAPFLLCSALLSIFMLILTHFTVLQHTT